MGVVRERAAVEDELARASATVQKGRFISRERSGRLRLRDSDMWALIRNYLFTLLVNQIK